MNTRVCRICLNPHLTAWQACLILSAGFRPPLTMHPDPLTVPPTTVSDAGPYHITRPSPTTNNEFQSMTRHPPQPCPPPSAAPLTNKFLVDTLSTLHITFQQFPTTTFQRIYHANRATPPTLPPHHSPQNTHAAASQIHLHLRLSTRAASTVIRRSDRPVAGSPPAARQLARGPFSLSALKGNWFTLHPRTKSGSCWWVF